MNILVIGTDISNCQAVNSIMNNIIERIVVSNNDVMFYTFGYGPDNKTISYSHHEINYIKNPFVGLSHIFCRIRRKMSRFFHIDSPFISDAYLKRNILKSLKQRPNLKIDCVIGAAGNFLYINVACKISRILGCRFFTMFFDPFTDNESSLNKRKRLSHELNWLKASEAIYYDEDGIKSNHYDLFSKKLRPFLIPIFEREKSSASNKNNIVYGGNFYRGFRESNIILEFVRKKENLEYNFDIYSNFNFNNESNNFINCTFHPMIDNDQFMSICSNAKAIIVIGNGNLEKTLPSKLLEAISFKKPIIGLNFVEIPTVAKQYPLFFDGRQDGVLKEIDNISVEKINIYDIFPNRNPNILVDQLLLDLFQKE